MRLRRNVHRFLCTVTSAKNFNKFHISGTYLYVPQVDFPSYEGQWPPTQCGYYRPLARTPRHISRDLNACLFSSHPSELKISVTWFQSCVKCGNKVKSRYDMTSWCGRNKLHFLDVSQSAIPEQRQRKN
jgi:hypothetical protein